MSNPISPRCVADHIVSTSFSPETPVENLGYRSSSTRYLTSLIAISKTILTALTTKISDRFITKARTKLDEYSVSAGDAKQWNRQVVVRIWECRDLDHVGHASITIKGSKSKKREHISWWPGHEYIQNKSIIGRITQFCGISRFFSQRAVSCLEDYQADKWCEISGASVERLKKGEQARAMIKEAEAKAEEISEDIKKDAEFSPRPKQKKMKNGEWGVSADKKIYLPMFGNSIDKNRNSRFMMFGLDEQAILKEARSVKSQAKHTDQNGNVQGKIGYTMVSKTENCASMAARMLRAGGAERFVQFNASWISENSNKILEYSELVQKKIDELNKKIKIVDTYFKKELRKDKEWEEIECGLIRDYHIKTYIKNLPDLIETIKTHFTEKIKSLSLEEQQSLENVIKVVESIITHRQAYDENIIRESQALVEVMHNLILEAKVSKPSPEILQVMRIVNTLLTVHKELAKQHANSEPRLVCW